MNTFLPYDSFEKSARALDRQRLGKQRVEVLQILRSLEGESKGWRNHPAVRMWGAYRGSLVRYGCAVCLEWTGRGYKDTCYGKILEFGEKYDYSVTPHWLGEEAFHASHRSNLLRKDPAWYGQFGWAEPPDLEYVWPVSA
ncbi:MAG: hypothetical protein GTN93_21410 [Anaerolineae bacterium]|nr:hypothetical protein [Anaerolineae bacterium]